MRRNIWNIRNHKGSLYESFKTQFEPVSWEDFCNHCKDECDSINIDTITCELYMDKPDYRIEGWNKTYILCASEGPIKNDIYPFAFSNDDINKLKK